MKNSADITRWKALADIDINQAASEFGALSSGDAQLFADKLGIDYLTRYVSLLSSDAAAEFLGPLSEDYRSRIIARLPDEKRAYLEELLSYAPGTAGALMAKEYFSISMESTIKEATEYLQSLPQEKKGKVSYVYAVDKDQRLEGVVQMRDLLSHQPANLIKDILKSPVVQVETKTPQIFVAKLLQRHRYLGMPVVDKNQRLVGIISADNALKVFQEEAEDDIAKIVGTSAEEIKTHSITKIISLRLPWLFISLISGLVCASILGFFDHNLQTIVTLFLFVPIVLGLSESTGIQGATIVVRNIALGNRSFKNLWLLLIRETLVGTFIGFSCGIVVGVLAALWQGNQMLGFALAISMTTTIIFSAVIGLLMPVIFMKANVDPALASGPLVLAVCDIQTLLVYFTLSSAIIK